jgi:predicted chitinase
MDQSTLNTLRDALHKHGFTNEVLIKGIAAEVFTETGFVLQAEMSYRNTPEARLRQLFGHRLTPYSDSQLAALKKNDVQFFDVIYGGQLGNTAPGDGFKYRGRGYNQITFKANYQNVGKSIGADLVNHPDLLLTVPVAAHALADFFKQTFSIAISNGSLRAKLGITSLSEINSPDLAVKTALQANAGFGKDITSPFFQAVLQKALAAFSKISFT